MFSNQVAKLIQDAIAVNVQLRDRAPNLLKEAFDRSADQTARDFLTVTVGTGQRTGKTQAMIELLRGDDLVLTYSPESAMTLKEIVVSSDWNGLPVGLRVAPLEELFHLVRQPDYVPPKRIWLDDGLCYSFDQLNVIYKETANNVNQLWIRLI